jgi:hypothetical protein
MNIKTRKSEIKIIRQDDPRFDISDGFVTSPRAGFEIAYGCPLEYKIVLQECINNGWLKPVAYMTEREMIFNGLGENNVNS